VDFGKHNAADFADHIVKQRLDLARRDAEIAALKKDMSAQSLKAKAYDEHVAREQDELRKKYGVMRKAFLQTLAQKYVDGTVPKDMEKDMELAEQQFPEESIKMLTQVMKISSCASATDQEVIDKLTAELNVYKTQKNELEKDLQLTKYSMQYNALAPTPLAPAGPGRLANPESRFEFQIASKPDPLEGVKTFALRQPTQAAAAVPPCAAPEPARAPVGFSGVRTYGDFGSFYPQQHQHQQFQHEAQQYSRVATGVSLASEGGSHGFTAVLPPPSALPHAPVGQQQYAPTHYAQISKEASGMTLSSIHAKLRETIPKRRL
jgi:hypothetical protein